MQNTAGYGWPYPQSSDHTRTWEYWEAQVKAIEATIRGGYSIFGHLTFGDATSTTAYSVVINKKESADIYKLTASIITGGFATLALQKNAVEVNRLRLGPDGNILINTTAQANARYLPYSMYTSVVSPLNFSNAAVASVAVTFPTGRFTQAPVVTAISWDVNYIAGANNATATGFTLWGRQADNIVHTGATTLSVHAIQMLAGSGAGLLAEPAPQHPQESVMCHTEGCENDGIPIVLQVPQETSAVLCGPCGRQITERTPI